MASKRTLRKPPIIVRRSAIQGRGVFATGRIRKGTRIIEYDGERIHPDQEEKRYDSKKMDRHHTFLFGVDEKTTVDAGVGGNDARFINHSCQPNCESVTINRRIYIEAVREIAPGEELSFDYLYEVDEPVTKRDVAFFFCKCGSAKCRGTMIAPSLLRKYRDRLGQRKNAADSRKAPRRPSRAQKSARVVTKRHRISPKKRARHAR